MPIKAGQISIEIRAAAQRLRGDMDENVRQVKRIGEAGREGGRELASGFDEGASSVKKVAKGALEAGVAVGELVSVGAELVRIGTRYAAVTGADASATEQFIGTLRALRVAASAAFPTIFGSVQFASATVAIGILAEETIRLVNARAKLIEQQSLIAAKSGMSISTIQRIDTVSGISGGNADNVRSLSGALSGRMDSDPHAVRTGLDTLGLPQSESAEDPALLQRIAAGFESIEDPAKRAAAAIQIFGAAKAGMALKELDSSFVEASAVVDQYGITLDQVSRNQIYQARQDFRRLYEAITDLSGEKTAWENLKTETEMVAAAADDMAKRVVRSATDILVAYSSTNRTLLPGLRELRSLTDGSMSGPATLSAAQLWSNMQRNDNISTGMTADDIFAHEQALARDKAGTLEGQRAAQVAAQNHADTAFGTLSADATKRQQNPNDPTLLSNTQRLSLAVQQQSAAALATAIGEKVAAMEAAAAAQKQAQATAEQLAAWQGKSGERLQELSDQITARAMADDPVSAARFSADQEINRDSDRTTQAERDARAKILALDVARVQQKEEQARDEKSAAAVLKEMADNPLSNPLSDLVPTRESSREHVRLDEESETRQRDAADRAERLATIQSQPGDEVALAQRILDIRLASVEAERAILAANAGNYTLEDQTLAAKKLETEEQNAQLTYENSIAEIEKAREQSALGTGGAYQQQLRALTQQADALNSIKVTDQNALDIDLARVALAQKQSDLEIQQLLALGTVKDGWDAFWLEMEEQAEKPGKILYDGMNSALDKMTADLSKLATGQRKGVHFGKDLQSVGQSVTQSAFKSMAQRGLGALGNKMGIHPAATKPDGTAGNPYHVIVDGSGSALKNPLAGMVPALPGAASGVAKAAGGIGGWLQKLFGSGGGSSAASGIGESVSSSITFMAGGGDADPGRIYGVAEAGEAEIVSPKNSARITPLSKAGMGGDTHYHNYDIDARGAQFGVENRVGLAIEMAHNSAVTRSVRATAERAKRTPQRRG